MSDAVYVPWLADFKQWRSALPVSSEYADKAIDIDKVFFDLIRQRIRANGGQKNISNRSIQRYFSTGWVPPIMLTAIRDLYPILPAEMANSMLGFINELVTTRYHWDRAIEDVYVNRVYLTEIARKYYGAFDVPPGVVFDSFPLLRRDGWIPDRMISVDSSRISCEFDPDFSGIVRPLTISRNIGSYTLFIMRRSAEKELFDGTSYRLLDVRTEPKLELIFGSGNYYSYLDTVEVLAAELALSTHGRGEGYVPSILPGRGDLDLTFRLKRRTAILGLNCLLLIRNYREDFDRPVRTVFVMHDRKGGSGHEAVNMHHVVPAGTFQPARKGEFSTTDFSFRRCLVREFFEEIFEMKQLQQQTSDGGDPLDRVGSAAEIMLDPDQTQLYFLGLGLDPLTTKPEGLFLMIVDWDAIDGVVLSDKMRKHGLLEQAKGRREGSTSYITFSKINIEAQLTSADRRLLPAGEACLRLALQNLEEICDTI